MLKKQLKKINKNIILSFICPFIIAFLVSISLGFIFGNKIVFVSDMKAQYSAFLSYYKDIFNDSSLLFYSFSKGIGGNMYSTVTYYLLSPFNLLLLLFNDKTLIYGTWLIIVLKMSLSGTTMYLFLKDEFKNNDKYLLLFSTSYALMAFCVNYYFNIMWLDTIYLLPLILIGINKIVKNENPLMYGLCLFLAIVVNYYMAFMLCIFSVLYFLYKILSIYSYKKSHKQIMTAFFRFFITSLLAGLMSTVILLPTIMELKNTDNTSFLTLDGSDNFLDITAVLSRLYLGSQDSANLLNAYTPHLYVGMIMLPLVYFYFVNRNIKKKEKILDGAMLLILSLGFVLPYVNMFWHGFVEPNGFNYRYSYLFSFFLIYLSYKSLLKIKKIPVFQYLIYLLIFIFMTFLVYFREFTYITYANILICLGATILYLFLLYSLHKDKYQDRKKLVGRLLVTLVFAELLYNFYTSVESYPLSFKNEYNGYLEVMSKETSLYKSSNDDFYRLEKDIPYSDIDGLLYNYNGISIFDSTLSQQMKTFFNNVGVQVLSRSINYTGNSTEILESILGVKYLFLTYTLKDNYNIVDSFLFSAYDDILFGLDERNVNIYENPYALNLGYMVSEQVNDFADIFINSDNLDNIAFQDIMLRTMVGSNDNYLNKIDIKKISDNNYELTVPAGQDFYLNIPFANIENNEYINIYLEDVLLDTYYLKRNGIMYVENNYDKDTLHLQIEIISETAQIYDPFAYYLNKTNFEQAISNLKTNQLDVEIMGNNYIKGSVVVSKDKTVLMTSIPYQDGFTVLVDGEKAEYYALFDTFIGVDFSEGTHNIEITFTPPGIKISAIISLISMIIFMSYIWFEKIIINFLYNIYAKYEEIFNYLIVGVLTTIISISLYYLFARFFNIDYYISTVMAWIISVLFAYITSKIFVFKKSKTKNLLKEGYSFYKYRLLSLVMEIVIMFILIELFLIDDMVAKIIVQIMVIIINYVFSKIFVFNKEILY
ncbi:MAG: YfhO family protein [Bacilli bacterium]|nr:YfhO family protein [Bacilli bacterium]